MTDGRTIIVAGTIKVLPEKLAALTPHIQTYVRACREEPGCLVFSFAEDLVVPGLIRVFEIWRGADALERHKSAPHVAAWRALWPEYGVHDRTLTRYDASAGDAF